MASSALLKSDLPGETLGEVGGSTEAGVAQICDVGQNWRSTLTAWNRSNLFLHGDRGDSFHPA